MAMPTMAKASMPQSRKRDVHWRAFERRHGDLVEDGFASPTSYLAAGVTAFTEIVSPLAEPVTVACCQANLFSSADTA